MNSSAKATHKQVRKFLEENRPDLLNKTTNKIKRAFRYLISKIEKIACYIISLFTCKPQEGYAEYKTLAKRLISIRVDSAKDMIDNAWLMLDNNKNCRAYRSNIKKMFEMFPNTNTVVFCDDNINDKYTSHMQQLVGLTDAEKEKGHYPAMPNVKVKEAYIFPEFTETKQVHKMVDDIFVNILNESNFNDSKEIQIIIETPNFSNNSNHDFLDSEIVAKEYIIACEAWMEKIQHLNNNKKVKLVLFTNIKHKDMVIKNAEHYVNNNIAYDQANKNLRKIDEVTKEIMIQEYIETRINPLLTQSSPLINPADTSTKTPYPEISFEYEPSQVKSYIPVNIKDTSLFVEDSSETSKNLVNDQIKKISYLCHDDFENYLNDISENIDCNQNANMITLYTDTLSINGITTNHSLNIKIDFTDTNGEIQNGHTAAQADLAEIQAKLQQAKLQTEDFFKDTSNISIQKKHKQPSNEQLYEVSYSHNIKLTDQSFKKTAFMALMNMATLGEIINQQGIEATDSSLKNEISRLVDNSYEKQTASLNSADSLNLWSTPVAEALDAFDMNAQKAYLLAQQQKTILNSILDNIGESSLEQESTDENTTTSKNEKSVSSNIKEKYIEYSFPFDIEQDEFTYAQAKTVDDDRPRQEASMHQGLSSSCLSKKTQVNLNTNITFYLPMFYKTELEQTKNETLAKLVQNHGAEKVLLAAMVGYSYS